MSTVNNIFVSIVEVLPKVSNNPLALTVIFASIIGYVIVAIKVTRYSNLLKHIKGLPESDRIRALRVEDGIGVPDNISAEHWLRARSQKYWFLAFAITAIVVVYLASLMLTNPSKPDQSVSVLDDLLHEQWVKLCFVKVPASWTHFADPINDSFVIFRPPAGTQLSEHNFAFKVDVLSTPTTQASERKNVPANWWPRLPHKDCYATGAGEEIPYLINLKSLTVKTTFQFEDGDSEGLCAFQLSEGATWLAKLDWDTNDVGDETSKQFVAFECESDKSISEDDFIKACRVLVERTTSSQDSTSFEQCQPDHDNGYISL